MKFYAVTHSILVSTAGAFVVPSHQPASRVVPLEGTSNNWIGNMVTTTVVGFALTTAAPQIAEAAVNPSFHEAPPTIVVSSATKEYDDALAAEVKAAKREAATDAAIAQADEFAVRKAEELAMQADAQEEIAEQVAEAAITNLKRAMTPAEKKAAAKAEKKAKVALVKAEQQAEKAEDMARTLEAKAEADEAIAEKAAALAKTEAKDLAKVQKAERRIASAN